MSKVTALYHIVFCTKRREKTIPLEMADHLYRYIWSVIKARKCILYRIGGIDNHVHMLIDLNTSVALADLMRDIKSQSSGWMNSDSRFSQFKGWAREYFAATLSYKDKDPVIQYIIDQRIHHGVTDFGTEIERLCANENMTLYKDDFI